MSNGFELKCRLAGSVKGVKGNKLQFMNVREDGGIELIDVKVKDVDPSQNAVLKQFVNKIVLLEPLKIFQDGWKKYYSVDSLRDIKILEK